MNNLIYKSSYRFIDSYNFVKFSFYGTKNYFQVLKRDSEVHEFVSKKTKPKQNLLSVFGVAGTGALGIKKMINNERKNGNVIVARKPYPLYFFSEPNRFKISIKDVACGYGFTVFSGRKKPYWEVYGCGLNNDSQLGIQEVPLNDQGQQIIMEPQIIKLPGQMNKINHISCGRAHSIIVGDINSANNNTQVIYSLGNNVFGQCGREIIENEIFLNNTIVHKINFSHRIKQVECGELTSYFLTEEGVVYGCGSNIHGQLANGDALTSSTPIKIGGNLEGEVVKQITSRFNTVMALTEKGEVWAWGDNQHGLVFSELDHSAVTSPKLLKMPETVGKIVQISAGNTVCTVVDENGKVHSWGQFLLGLGPNNDSSLTPKMIPQGLFGGGLHAIDGSNSKVISVNCGLRHCLAVTSSGCLFFWGEAGIIKNGSQTFPVRIPLTFNAKRTFVGADHSIIMGGLDL